MSPTPAEVYGKGAITPSRCTAIRALRRDGMTTDEVAFVLEISEKAVTRHGGGRCDCPDELGPVSGRAKDTNTPRRGGGY